MGMPVWIEAPMRASKSRKLGQQTVNARRM